MLQQDSIAQHEVSAMAADSVVAPRVITPATVLSWLPRDATPAQQDSAIQAHFQPSEIRWSERPDTLHLPGHDAGVDWMKADLPQYYKESFFSKDTLFHPELPGGRYGVAGDPVPYTVQGDNIITSLLLVSFLMAVIAFSNVRRFIARQAKDFFYSSREGTTEVTETANEMRFQLFLVLLTSLLLALQFYFYTIDNIGDVFVLPSEYHLIGIYSAMVVGYFALKALLYTAVNLVFFDGKRNVQWLKALLFIISIEGVLTFPAVLLRAYFDLSMQNVEVYMIFVFVLVELLTFYKCFIIFFKRNVVRLQIILYFCTLEMIPLLAFWGALVITGNELKINF